MCQISISSEHSFNKAYHDSYIADLFKKVNLQSVIEVGLHLFAKYVFMLKLQSKNLA